MEVGGHLYTRISNPTVAALEQRLAALEVDNALACSGEWLCTCGFSNLW